MDDLTGCFNLQTIGLAAHNELSSSIDGNLYFKDKTMLLFVNRNVTSYTIPDTVTFIHAYAFDGCVNMTKIVIPKTVTYINAWAFKNCPGLTIYCEAGSDQVHWNPAWNYDNLPVVWNYVGQ
jgi:hypothetical protein